MKYNNLEEKVQHLTQNPEVLKEELVNVYTHMKDNVGGYLESKFDQHTGNDSMGSKFDEKYQKVEDILEELKNLPAENFSLAVDERGVGVINVEGITGKSGMVEADKLKDSKLDVFEKDGNKSLYIKEVGPRDISVLKDTVEDVKYSQFIVAFNDQEGKLAENPFLLTHFPGDDIVPEEVFFEEEKFKDVKYVRMTGKQIEVVSKVKEQDEEISK